MSRKVLALLLTLLACIGGGVAIAGCGADDPDGADVAKAAESTAAKKTAKVEMSMKLTATGLPTAFSLKGTGVTDLTKPRGDLSFDLGDIVRAVGVPESKIGNDTTLQVRYDGAKVYAKLPDAPEISKGLGGKRWVAADIAQLAPALGVDTKGLGKLMTVDPASQMKTLSSLDGMKQVAKETLDGAGVTHFKGTYTAQDLIDALPADKRAAIEKAMKQTAALPGAKDALKTPQNAELWVDDQGVARKMQLSATLPGGMGSYTMDYHLTDFGTPLDVSAPPAGDTLTITPQMVSKLMSGALVP